MSKTYTEKTAVAVCTRLLREASKKTLDLGSAWIDEQGRQCFCDGYRVYRLLNPLPDMPTAKTHRAARCTADVFKPFDTGNVVEIPAPDPNAVKSFVDAHKIQRKSKRVFDRAPFDMGEEFPLLNPLFMQEILRLFPGAAWYVNADPAARMNSPVFIKHDQGTACIMPVRRNETIKEVTDAGEYNRVLSPEEFIENLSMTALSPADFAAMLAA